MWPSREAGTVSGRAFASRWEMLANGIGNLALSARAEGDQGRVGSRWLFSRTGSYGLRHDKV